MWFTGVEVEQETSAPPPKKILDPLLNVLTNWAMKTHSLGAGRFVEFILTREWNDAVKMMWTAEILI